jgi:hypothetical protein
MKKFCTDVLVRRSVGGYINPPLDFSQGIPVDSDHPGSKRKPFKQIGCSLRQTSSRIPQCSTVQNHKPNKLNNSKELAEKQKMWFIILNFVR